MEAKAFHIKRLRSTLGIRGIDEIVQLFIAPCTEVQPCSKPNSKTIVVKINNIW